MKPNRKLLLVSLVLVAAVVGGVFASRGGTTVRETASVTTTFDTVEAADDPARAVPTFTADLRGGGSLDSTELQGPAMIQVFASWCPNCQSHAPNVARVQQEFEGLETYYINVADDASPAAGFIDEYEWADSPVLVDDDRSIASQFGLTGQPHTIFLDGDGNVAEVLEGGGELGAMRSAARRVTAS